MYSTMSDRANNGGGSQMKYTVAVSPLAVTPSLLSLVGGGSSTSREKYKFLMFYINIILSFWKNLPKSLACTICSLVVSEHVMVTEGWFDDKGNLSSDVIND